MISPTSVVLFPGTTLLSRKWFKYRIKDRVLNPIFAGVRKIMTAVFWKII